MDYTSQLENIITALDTVSQQATLISSVNVGIVSFLGIVTGVLLAIIFWRSM